MHDALGDLGEWALLSGGRFCPKDSLPAPRRDDHVATIAGRGIATGSGAVKTTETTSASGAPPRFDTRPPVRYGPVGGDS